MKNILQLNLIMEVENIAKEGSTMLLSLHNNLILTYWRPFCVAWTQLPLAKASGDQGLAHRTHTHR